MTPSPQQLEEMYAWYEARKAQQLSLPVDDASRNALGTPLISGAGSSGLTDTITIGAGGGSANVPKAYTGTFIIVSGGIQYEVGYIRTV